MPDSAAWTLSGIEPADNTFRDAGEEVHRAFWKWIAAIGIDRFHWRCNQGIGANGQALTPIAASTARRGRKRSYTGLGNAGNPPLVPALGLSRTEALLKGRGFADHAEWYWTVDPVTGLHWGQMMLWHAAGGNGRYPVRNVIGWSQADIAWLRAQGATWWYAHQHGQAVARAMNELETTRDKFPRLAAAAPAPGFFKVAKGARTDVKNAVFSNGAAAVSARAIAEGNSTGFRVTSGGWGSKGGGKATPKTPKPPVKRAAMKQAAPPKPKPAPPVAPPPPKPQTGADRRDLAAWTVKHTAGIPAIKDGHSLIEKGTSAAQAKNIPAAFVFNTQGHRAIALNESHPYWDDPAAWMAQARASQWLASDNPEHPVHHEIGHALHYARVGHGDYIAIRNTYFTVQQRDLIERQVGRYAATEPQEFVAEVYAARKAGVTFEPEVLALYNHFRGPTP